MPRRLRSKDPAAFVQEDLEWIKAKYHIELSPEEYRIVLLYLLGQRIGWSIKSSYSGKDAGFLAACIRVCSQMPQKPPSELPQSTLIPRDGIKDLVPLIPRGASIRPENPKGE